MSNRTWEIVDRPNNRKLIGSRFVLKTKLDRNGDVDRRKARLVAKGYAQRPGMDFLDTFAPVARGSTIRLMMALSAELGLTVHQMDVVTAFLNGEVEEEIYLDLPDQLENTLSDIIENPKGVDASLLELAKQWMGEIRSNGQKACRVRKAIYGLKQSGRQWFKRLDRELKQLGLQPTKCDPCLYYRRTGAVITLFAVYVDDILIATNDCGKNGEMDQLKQTLMKTFKMKDMRPVSYCLGIEFQQHSDGSISMCQSKYSKEILTRFNMDDCNPISTPLDGNEKLKKPDSQEDTTKYPYQSLIGSLMYLAVSTRPDISYTVSALSQFNQNHGEEHWNAAKRVLRYLKGTLDYGLTFRKTGESLHGYVDADWAGCIDDRRSFTGYCFILADAAISWEAKKQRTVALSSTEAEYMALSEGTKEALYLQNLLGELDLKTNPIVLFNDNQGAQELMKNPVHHTRTKHIDVRHHFVREAYEEGKIEPRYLPTEEMVADVFTKSFFGPKHNVCTEWLGVSNLSP